LSGGGRRGESLPKQPHESRASESDRVDDDPKRFRWLAASLLIDNLYSPLKMAA